MPSKPTSPPEQPVMDFAERPTSPPPPRKKTLPPVTLIGVEALAVGQVVDQLENTIRVLIGLYKEKSWKKVTRGEIVYRSSLSQPCAPCDSATVRRRLTTLRSSDTLQGR